MIRLSIKGCLSDAIKSAERYGIPLFSWSQPGSIPRFPAPPSTFASCEEKHRRAIMAWYADGCGEKIVEGFGFPVGTLLYYTGP